MRLALCRVFAAVQTLVRCCAVRVINLSVADPPTSRPTVALSSCRLSSSNDSVIALSSLDLRCNLPDRPPDGLNNETPSSLLAAETVV